VEGANVVESKIRIKMGPIEVDYQGDSGYLNKDLLALMTALADLFKEARLVNEETDTPADPRGKSRKAKEALTTTSIATRLGCKSGADLAIAAAARLTLMSGVDAFPRDSLLKEMRSAKQYYKASYNNNLTGTLKRLVKSDQLRDVGSDSFALSAKKKSELETALA
jgi:hypothetical protein